MLSERQSSLPLVLVTFPCGHAGPDFVASIVVDDIATDRPTPAQTADRRLRIRDAAILQNIMLDDPLHRARGRGEGCREVERLARDGLGREEDVVNALEGPALREDVDERAGGAVVAEHLVRAERRHVQVAVGTPLEESRPLGVQLRSGTERPERRARRAVEAVDVVPVRQRDVRLPARSERAAFLFPRWHGHEHADEGPADRVETQHLFTAANVEVAVGPEGQPRRIGQASPIEASQEGPGGAVRNEHLTGPRVEQRAVEIPVCPEDHVDRCSREPRNEGVDERTRRRIEPQHGIRASDVELAGRQEQRAGLAQSTVSGVGEHPLERAGRAVVVQHPAIGLTGHEQIEVGPRRGGRATQRPSHEQQNPRQPDFDMSGLP
jgi:hypothetical protein